MPAPTRTTLVACTLLAAIVAPIGACKKQPASKSTTAQQGSQTTVVLRRYSVRAEVTQVSAEGEGLLIARHEAIPDFQSVSDFVKVEKA